MSEGRTDYTNSYRSKNRQSGNSGSGRVIVGGGQDNLPAQKDRILENAAKDVGSQILVNVLVPSIQNLVRTLLEKLSEKWFKETPDKRNDNDVDSDGVVVKSRDANPSMSIEERMRCVKPVTEEQARKVLNKLHRDIQDYGWATVSKFFAENKVPTAYTDDNYGWDTTRGMDYKLVDPEKNLWSFVLPRWRWIK